ncbi:uncharacterized protein [Clytia hemisphaerica]|uniref:uncharacterized protein n=1 Tax=Clytia hemisphaerica TaxID=252671 RepID=UPI0034D600FA
MQYLIFVLAMILWLSGEFGGFSHGCRPTMYLQKFNKEILKIPVSTLTINRSHSLNDLYWSLNVVMQRKFRYKCYYNEKGYEIKLYKETLNTLQRLNYLDVTGISSAFKPKVACNPVSAFTDGNTANAYTIYYLGEYKGTWQMHEKYSFLNPRFFLYINHERNAPKGQEHWYLGAVGKYYPCLEYGLNQYNAYAWSYRGKITTVNVKGNVQFEPSWVHQYMSHTGEDAHTNLLTKQIEKVLDMGLYHPTKLYYELQLHETDPDQNLILVSNPEATIGPDRIKVRASFKIYDHYWEGTLMARNETWRQLVEYGFPTKDNPFVSFQNSGLKAPILKGISSISDILLRAEHGDWSGRKYHDGVESYTVTVDGQFSNDPAKVPADFFRGVDFSLSAHGKWLEDSHLIFVRANCHDSQGPMKEKLKTVWKRMRAAIPKDDSSIPDKLVESKGEVSPTKLHHTCPSGQFRLIKFNFKYPQTHNNHYYVTLSWVANEDGTYTRYDCTAFMLIADFVKIFEKAGV